MCNSIGARYVAIDDAQQAERLSLLFELFVDARVVAAKCAHTDDHDIYDAGGMQRGFSGQPVAAEWIVLRKDRRAI